MSSANEWPKIQEFYCIVTGKLPDLEEFQGGKKQIKCIDHRTGQSIQLNRTGGVYTRLFVSSFVIPSVGINANDR